MAIRQSHSSQRQSKPVSHICSSPDCFTITPIERHHEQYVDESYVDLVFRATCPTARAKAESMGLVFGNRSDLDSRESVIPTTQQEDLLLLALTK